MSWRSRWLLVAPGLAVLLAVVVPAASRAQGGAPARAAATAAAAPAPVSAAVAPSAPASSPARDGAPSASAAVAPSAPAPAAPDAAEAAFLADVVALTRAPHRVSGSPPGRAAGDYLVARLGALGFAQVLPLEFPVWFARTRRAELRVAGRRVELWPLRPNTVVNPVTPAGGVTGPRWYVGRGAAREYGARRPEGAIVVMEYDSEDAWEQAFALGAAAVVFVGDGDETPFRPKHVGVPTAEPRFYAPRAAFAGVDLAQEHPDATLVSQVTWELGRGRDLVVRVPGTDPGFGDARPEAEAVVLAAAYDSYGVGPELSAGARGAANVAALLEAAARFRRDPPRRDTWFVFLDAQARAHQGARALYAALAQSPAVARATHQGLRDERAHVAAMRELLDREGLGFDGGAAAAVAGARVGDWLTVALRSEAGYARDDARHALGVARLGGAAADPARLAALDTLALRWDEVRRALHGGQLAALVGAHAADDPTVPGTYAALLGELSARTRARFERRLRELDAELTAAEQRDRLREALGWDGPGLAPWIALHVTYDLGDQGGTWGVVVGDSTQRLFPWRTPRLEGDTPGYYGRVLNAVAEAAALTRPEGFDRRTIEDPELGPSFAPGHHVAGGAVAGAYGYYNVALMSGYDARARDGHPADTLERLGWRTLRRQAAEATELLRALADGPGLSLPAVFTPTARSKAPRWVRGRVEGDYVGLVVSGGLAEDRPATGALVALWPGNPAWKTHVWSTLEEAGALASYEPIAFEVVDGNGRFPIVGFRDDMHEHVATLGARFDEQGLPVALSAAEQQIQLLSGAMRLNLVTGSGGRFVTLETHAADPAALRVLKASSDAPFRDSRALSGVLAGHGFFHVSDQVGPYRVKVFQPLGPVALGDLGPDHEYGAGVDPRELQGGRALGERTAADLYALNEKRLAVLREHGVTSADLERLHGRARRLQEQGLAARSVALRQGLLARSAALSQRVYAPLREAMDDLVHAVVVLLLLSIPFAFAMERLLVGATTIYGRIAGFFVIFLATFGLLYWLHPGFAIASTPVIVFLAFAIVLLSSLVIYLVVRKFRVELAALQGQRAAAHDARVSPAATTLAAIAMGMSTMRRRPTRTLLTAITVVMLTFTILAFASFSRTVGVRAFYEGPVDERVAPGVLVRKVDYSAMPEGVLVTLFGEAGEGGLMAPHYWLVRKEATAPRLTVARTDDGRSLTIDGVLGVPAAQLERWPALARALTAAEGPAAAATLGGGVLVPPIVRDVLGLRAGDEVLLSGRRLRVAGTLDAAALQRVRHLDRQPILPVDFQDPTSQLQRPPAGAGSSAAELLLTEDTVRDFVHLGGDQVVVAEASVVKALGGRLHAVSLHPGPGVAAPERGRRLAEVLVMPVWAAGPEGVERLVLTVLTEVTGGFALFVPLLLGGLIIFGTLLGSISDREKEIYTFSALGLSPSHVGVLFFAEAGVYAIVGGVGGQLLAQLVGRVVTALSNAGRLPPVSLNFSSSNSLFAIGVVMATVLLSAAYPAVRASRSANPGLSRTFAIPRPEGDEIRLVFPFTVSAYDVTGVVSYLAEHFESHDDAGLGGFAASGVALGRTAAGHLELAADLALAPFDLGVTQRLVLTAVPSEIEGVDEVVILVRRTSGAAADWCRANAVFMKDLRRQFLLWRTLAPELIERYRQATLVALGVNAASGAGDDG